jgi:hypothetical protein
MDISFVPFAFFGGNSAWRIGLTEKLDCLLPILRFSQLGLFNGFLNARDRRTLRAWHRTSIEDGSAPGPQKNAENTKEENQ